MAEDFLRRWSRLKRENAPAEKPPAEAAIAPREEAKLPALPPADQLTPESDFTGFMQPKVEDALRRAALKKLFNDPHFNVADPFEPFSGDWTGGEAISQEMLATLNQARTVLFAEKEEKREPGDGQAPAQAGEPEEQAAGERKPDEPRRQDA